jgi:hypothetical protein
MRTIHQKLHLQHHHHTGKLLHHRHTSYRAIFGLLAIVGVFMLGLAYVQHAAVNAFSVGATVHVPVPHTPATVVKPVDGASVPSGDTMIIGSCPLVVPAPIIVITIDNQPAGSAACNTENNFSFSAHLAAGQHQIVTTPYTVDGDKGPESAPLSITSQGTAAANTLGDTLTTTGLFSTVDSNRNVTWSGTITGDQKSYTLLLEWGDGSYDSYTVEPGPRSFHHRYAQLASYNMTVGIKDASGKFQYAQFAATAADPAALTALSPTTETDTQSGTVIGLYGLFVTIVALSAIVRLHAVPFAYAPIRITHHAAH